MLYKVGDILEIIDLSSYRGEYFEYKVGSVEHSLEVREEMIGAKPIKVLKVDKKNEIYFGSDGFLYCEDMIRGRA